MKTTKRPQVIILSNHTESGLKYRMERLGLQATPKAATYQALSPEEALGCPLPKERRQDRQPAEFREMGVGVSQVDRIMAAMDWRGRG